MVFCNCLKSASCEFNGGDAKMSNKETSCEFNGGDAKMSKKQAVNLIVVILGYLCTVFHYNQFL